MGDSATIVTVATVTAMFFISYIIHGPNVGWNFDINKAFDTLVINI